MSESEKAETRTLSSHSFQVPGDHLRRIGTVELNAITPRYSSVDLGYDTNPEGGSPREDDSPDHISGSGYVSPYLIDSMGPSPPQGRILIWRSVFVMGN